MRNSIVYCGSAIARFYGVFLDFVTSEAEA